MANEERGSTARWMPTLIVVAIGVVITALILVTGAFIVILSLARNTPSHRCALRIALASPAVAHYTGTPVYERGKGRFTVSYGDGVTTSHDAFVLAGPSGAVNLRAEGSKSRFDSNLVITMTSGSTKTIVYSGPYECR